MQNFIETFKNKSKTKSLESEDMLSLCLYRAVKAKAEDKEAVLLGQIKRTFTEGNQASPKRVYPYSAVRDAACQVSQHLNQRSWDGTKFISSSTFLGIDINDVFTESEQLLLQDLLKKAKEFAKLHYEGKLA